MTTRFNDTWVASITLAEFLEHCQLQKGKYGMSDVDAEGYYNKVKAEKAESDKKKAE